MKKFYLIITIIFFLSLLIPLKLFGQYYTENYDEYAPKSFLFVVDCSKRMNRKFNDEDEKRKIDLIKYWLPEYIEKLPFGIPIGIRVYGHEDGMITFSKCDNSDIISYVGTEKRHNIEQVLDKIDMSKEIPLGFALNKAITYDFTDVGGYKEIILITDNIGNCKSKPCKIVQNLLKKRNDIKINIIGFGVKSKSVEKNLKCLIADSSGEYFNVNNLDEFKTVLNKIILGSTSPCSK
ncbi:MAG: VWA domain-containing protein [Cyanobacteriota bacterium]